jgi:hypothetical protein
VAAGCAAREDHAVTDVLGWAGSALLVYSLLQTRVLRFRVLNLAAAVALVVFNALIQVWPMVAMNVVIAGINGWHIARLLRTRHDDRHYDVVPVGGGESYLRHLLERHRADIERFNPGVLVPSRPAGLSGSADDEHTAVLAGADLAGDPESRLAFLVLSGGETVGMVLAHRSAPGEAQVDLDYVLPRFRDFTPGEFVYRPDGPFARLGVRRVVAPPRMRDSERYLAGIGFRPRGDDLVLDI